MSMFRGTIGWFSLLLVFALFAASANPVFGAAAWHAVPAPDQSDWSPKRVTNYARLDGSESGEPIAVVAVPALAVSARVYADSAPQALEAGAAWVTGTAPPGSKGNIVIAGHRDSFFRPLEGIPLGTVIDLTTAAGVQSFKVVEISIVDPLDMHPLDGSDDAILTLITCHPFRYLGYAPDRYIIRAEIKGAG